MVHDLRTFLSVLAIAIGGVIALALPAVYLWRDLVATRAHMENAVGVASITISRVIARTPDTWRFEENLLGELLIFRSVISHGDHHEAMRLVEPDGRIILEIGPALPAPVMARRAPLYDAGAVVAYVEDRHSLRSVLYRTGFVGIAGIVLGLAVFGMLQWLPLRALDRALAKAREEARKADSELTRRTDLERSRDRLDTLLKTSPVVIYSAKVSGDYGATFVSENVRTQLGYNAGEFTADPGFWASRIHPEDRERVFAHLPALFETGEHTHEYRFHHKDGSWRWMHDELKVTRDASGAPQELVGFWLDVTERKRAEEALESLSRMKSEFMANVTHELRTPLNSVIGFAELLKDEVPGQLNAKQAAFVTDILAGGQRLLALVEGILEMSRLDAAGFTLAREPVEIGAELKQCAAAHRAAAAARGLTLSLEVAADAGSTELDPKALRRMLDALLDNAVKFNREGGAVALRARRAGGWLEISVADTGIGIAREDLGKLFQPLVQLDVGLARRAGGIGLGLTLARRLAELHGGTIEVESEPGKGSTFTLRLPETEEA